MYPQHLKKRTTRAWQGLVLLPPAETMIENVYAARFVSERGRGVQLGDPFESAFPARKGGHESEEDDVRRIRDWRTRVKGKSLRILRGDTHRHTEFSLDLRGVPDREPTIIHQRYTSVRSRQGTRHETT